MRVRIVCYEAVHSWILGKFAIKMQEELSRLSVSADIAKTPDPAADINHHIIYLDYHAAVHSVDTLMITHIDADWKFRKLKAQIESASLGICMSADTMNRLVHAGLPAHKLCYVNPAHDGIFKPRPYRIGLTSRIYPDGRKREWMLLSLADRIRPDEFTFSIMGEGWDAIIDGLKTKGFQVEYSSSFDPERYQQLMESLDYYLNLGNDEGAMAFVDALASGVPTITTPQGYHLDAEDGLTHPFKTEEELFSIFETIGRKKRDLVRSVASWTWSNYALKHRDLWEYLLTGKRTEGRDFRDGLASLGSSAASASFFANGKARLHYIGQSVSAILSRRR